MLAAPDVVLEMGNVKATDCTVKSTTWSIAGNASDIANANAEKTDVQESGRDGVVFISTGTHRRSPVTIGCAGERCFAMTFACALTDSDCGSY